MLNVTHYKCGYVTSVTHYTLSILRQDKGRGKRQYLLWTAGDPLPSGQAHARVSQVNLEDILLTPLPWH